MTNYQISDFYCTQCGNKGIPIVRKKGQDREAGHLKNLFCLHCKTTTNHCEIRPYGTYTYDNFIDEFNCGRFLPNGTRIPESELLLCSKGDCLYNRKGKCWNSNGSYAECHHRPKGGNDNS